MHGKFVTTIWSDQSLAVDKPECLGCLLFGKAAVHKVIFQHGGNTNASTSCSKEDKSMFMRFYPGATNCVDEPTKDDRRSSLNLSLDGNLTRYYIVIETALPISPFIKKFEGQLGIEIFELNKHFRPTLFDSSHEFCNKFFCLWIWNSFLSKAKVKGIVEVLFIVGSIIQSDLQSELELRWEIQEACD